ncbi:YopX family protein [Clostridioides difficile]|nr:YopX family protein [Clostridioides difficile]MDI3004253.1 YopX family protein [Clostridioides difficile]
MKIKTFRGKSIKNNHWVYGYYYSTGVNDTKIHKIVYNTGKPDLIDHHIPIKRNTLGEITFKKDSDGINIYSDDIVHSIVYIAKNDMKDLYFDKKSIIGVVKFHNGSWKIYDGDSYYLLFNESNEITIIGNKYDNEDLIKKYNLCTKNRGDLFE